MKKSLYQWLCYGGLLLASVNVAAKPLVFGVVPQQSAKVLAQRWSPIMNYLSHSTSLDIRFATAKDIPTFEKRVAAGEYDFAYMNPYHFTVFNQIPGYQAVAKQQGKRIKGIVVAHKKSSLKSLNELEGKHVAFPSPAAFAASIIPQAQMDLNNIKITPHYVSSHDSVYRSVAQGFFPAGGGIIRTFNNAPADIREQLRVLWTSPGYTPHAIAAHPKLSAGIKEEVQKALVGMAGNAEGQKLLAGLKMKAFEKATDKDWDDVRSLKIKLLNDFVQ